LKKWRALFVLEGGRELIVRPVQGKKRPFSISVETGKRGRRKIYFKKIAWLGSHPANPVALKGKDRALLCRKRGGNPSLYSCARVPRDPFAPEGQEKKGAFSSYASDEEKRVPYLSTGKYSFSGKASPLPALLTLFRECFALIHLKGFFLERRGCFLPIVAQNKSSPKDREGFFSSRERKGRPRRMRERENRPTSLYPQKGKEEESYLIFRIESAETLRKRRWTVT